MLNLNSISKRGNILILLVLFTGSDNLSETRGNQSGNPYQRASIKELFLTCEQANHHATVMGIALTNNLKKEEHITMLKIDRKPPPLPFDKKRAKRKTRTIKRSRFVELMFTPDGRQPFSFVGRKYLKPLYNWCCRQLVLMCSRQSEKTTFEGLDMQMDAILNPSDRLLFVTGFKDQVVDIVRHKIDVQFSWNPRLFQSLLGPGSINSTHEKQFTNGSSLSFRYAGWGADSLRGRSVRKIYFDECQLIPSDHVQVIMESTQAFPDTSAHYFVGTPLDSRNPLCRRFAASKQFEWCISCDHCGHLHGPLGIENIDPKRPYLFCLSCGKKMDPTRGKWIAKNPSSVVAGFRICRLMTPACRWTTASGGGILDKLKTYSEARFYNEVLGLPFDIGVLPISEPELRACCQDEPMLTPDNVPEWVFGKELFMAVDWAYSSTSGAQSSTIMAIGFRDTDKICLLYAKRFVGSPYQNPDTVLEEILRTAAQFKVLIIGTDFGIGHKENIRLRARGVQQKVVEMLYTNQHTMSTYDPAAQCYKLGRTLNLDLVFSDLKQQKIHFPRWEQFKYFLGDALNVFTEHDADTRLHHYHHAGTGPDDFLHLLVYLKVLIRHYYHF